MIPNLILPSTSFGHVITAMVTPFGVDGRLNIPLAMQLAEYLVTHGSDSLIICGTTGESPTLTLREQHQLFKAVRQAVGNQVNLLVGTGSNATAETIERTKEAAHLGADGALLVVPYYNKPPQDGLEAHFRAIAKEVPSLPLMLYNIPSRTGCSLAPETVGRLMDLTNIVSFKAASSSIEEISQLREACGERLAIYSGDDELTLPLLIVGAIGVVSVASHLAGRQINSMIKYFMAGDNTAALSIHEKLIPLFKGLFIVTNPIPVKAALELSGWFVGGPRLPLLSANKYIRESLSPILVTLRHS
uniref:4-hydroxy-tetrahydrodipicolinate synthase n=1 Tax=Paulinella chromatophora TaxID=39717 RepID=B1X4L0_PAUCH|nr:dihydrodipicolinate synthase [Paulinella chromatophora]ACB42879.1 dihydrodipicolinate synthase [Paulinella chromatophora]|eukprot:gb/GEZN01000603.1/.p3 GENE.gb/GEZN01000603.1/~~gb/GEZN01000603.1/.p3  ORF type:complete len:303 (-),score=0.93 gb/GEZN01000603.1/:2199-3107(-)